MNTQDIATLSALTAAVIQIDKRFGVQITRALPEGWRWVPVVGVASVLAVAEGLGAGLPWPDVAVNAIGAALGAMGANAALTESPLPWNGGAGGKPKHGR